MHGSGSLIRKMFNFCSKFVFLRLTNVVNIGILSADNEA